MAPRRFEMLVWAGLAAAMAVVGLLFVRSHPPSEPLPVIAAVPDFALTNQFGLAVTRENLGGFVWVANVIFTRCPGQCHRLSQQMRHVQQALPVGAPVRLVSLSADPEFDAPAVLHRYGTRYHYDTNNWLFLTGPKRAVYQLATAGLKFSVVENDNPNASLEEQFIHSTHFVIVDRAGQLRAVVQGESSTAEAQILARVQQLLAEPHP